MGSESPIQLVTLSVGHGHIVRILSDPIPEGLHVAEALLWRHVIEAIVGAAHTSGSVSLPSRHAERQGWKKNGFW